MEDDKNITPPVLEAGLEENRTGDKVQNEGYPTCNQKTSGRRHPREIATSYLNRGWCPIPLLPKDKEPAIKWKEFEPKVKNLQLFHDLSNIGIKLGGNSNGLVDIDCDWPESAKVAEELFNDLPSFGRKSARGGHRISYCKEKTGIKSRKYTLPKNEALTGKLPTEHEVCVIELRGDNTQTMFPGSVHPCGELIEWETLHKQVPEFTYEQLIKRTGLIAFLSVVLRFYPLKGTRDEMHMALAGALARAGYEADDINKISKILAKLNGDEEWDARGKGDETVKRIADGEETTGLPHLLKLLGLPEEFAKTFREWLQIQKDDVLFLSKNTPLLTARLFVQQKHPNLMFYNNDYLTFDKVEYREIEEGRIKSDIYDFMAKAFEPSDKEPHPFNPNKSKVGNALDALQAIAHVERDVYVPPCWLEENNIDSKEIVACQNGLLHLPTNVLLPATPDFFTRNALEFDYQQNAPEPLRWLEFLNSLWLNDSDTISTLQEIFGYLLIPDTSLQKIFLLIGPPRSGKGTIAKIITKLIGEDNVCAPTLSSLSKDFGMQSMVGKQLALISDMRVGRKTDKASVTEHLLNISGNDKVTVTRKYKRDWEGVLNIRFFIMTNEIPSLYDTSGALASRFVPLVMRKSFLQKENPNLINELLPELPGILNWAIEGWKRLYKRQHFIVPSDSYEVIDILTRSSSDIKGFIKDECELQADYSILKDELFASWKLWCQKQGDINAGTLNSFARDLLAANGEIKSSKETSGARRPVYRGIRLKPDYSPY